MLGMDHNKACLKFLIRNCYFSLDDLYIVSSAHSWWERGNSFQRQVSLSLFLLPYLCHIITKFFLEDLQLSSFFCQRTTSPLTDCSSITDLITSHSIFAVRFFSCLPTSAKEKAVQNPKESFRKYVLIRSTQKKHLLNRWSRRVCLLIGYFLASLNLATFAIELYCSNFCKERTWWQKNCYCSNNGGLVR